MAVSMNSGFMRSDFMISDAALPMRMEELEQLEQTQKFAELLGDIGNSANREMPEAAAQEAMTTAEVSKVELVSDASAAKTTVVISKSELKKLAEAVIEGEIRLDELPEELVSDVLLMAIAMMMLGVPEDDIAALQEDYTVTVTEVEADTMSQFVELIMVPSLNGENAAEAQMPITTFEIPDELKAEVQSVINKIVNAQDDFSDSNEVITKTVSADETMAVALDTADEAVLDTDVKPEKDTEAKPVGIVAEADVTVENMQSVVAGKKTAPHSDILPDQSNAVLKQAAQSAKTGVAEQPVLNEEFEQLRQIISQVTVKRPEVQQTAQQSYTVQSYGVDEQVRGRLVSKSDELALLKNAVKPAEIDLAASAEAKATAIETNAETSVEVNVGNNSENGAQSQTDVNAQTAAMLNIPQTASTEAPVVFTRADGTEITVKRDEVIRQVVTNVVEQTTNTDGDTEYSITLEPHDLGSITVRMTKTADGTFSVSITAENARTQRIIEESGLALQNSLRQNGIELESWQTVNESEQQERAEDYNGSSKNPYYHEEHNENDDADDTSFAEMISAM